MSLIDDINTIARGCGVDLIDKAMRALDPPVRSSADKSYVTSHGQKDAPPDDAGTAGVVDPNYDGAPYCSHCGAQKARWCTCGPIADNE